MAHSSTYHYCSLETACAIIGNRTLRLSDITKSNDSAEIEYGYAAAFEGLVRSGLVERRGADVHFTDDWIEALRPEYRRMLHDALTRHQVPPNRICYAICFSEKPDLLSQWRAYGDDGRGLSLGFDLSGFKAHEDALPVGHDEAHPLENHMMLRYRPIIYGRQRSAELFDELASQVQSDVQRLREASPAQREPIQAALLDSTLAFVAATAFCKKRFFREEREWRLSIWGPNANDAHLDDHHAGLAHALMRRFPQLVTGVSFQALPRAHQLVPTIDLGIDLRHALRSIVIGPRCGASADDLRMLLATAGLDEVRIERSHGTYR